MMLNDYQCAKHGVFEGSHPICPAMGCDSSDVKKVFIKAPAVKSDYTKRFDAGMRQSAEMYHQADWKSAQEGDSAKAHNRASELRWGDDAAGFLGGNIEAALPRGVADGAPALGLVQEHGQSPLARAERTGVKKQDDQWRQNLTAIAKPSA